MIKNKNNQRGFSFLEAVISIFLLSTGIVAVMMLVSGSLREINRARDHQIAVMLAEEGIELTRNVRDNNWVDPTATSTFVDTNVDGYADFPQEDAYNCIVHYIEESDHLRCRDDISKRLRVDSNGCYRYGGSDNNWTKFYRNIYVEYDTGDRATADSATITSVVYWASTTPPASPVTLANCNAANSCAFAKVDLRKWGE